MLIRSFFKNQKKPFHYTLIIFVSLERKSKSLWHGHNIRVSANHRNTIHNFVHQITPNNIVNLQLHYKDRNYR